MSTHPDLPALSPGILRAAIRKEYACVAQKPDQGFHFHTGRAATGRLGYESHQLAGVPPANLASFAGTGNPFLAGAIHPGETVVDIGSGAGMDALIAARLVGPAGRVIGVDMTPEMLAKARQGAAAMGLPNVEFREGFAEALHLPHAVADVLISNGVLNLTIDKAATLREWFRVLKPGGRLQVGDILVDRELPPDALADIALWTG
jgi:SAM-dependent methyltransferase